MKRLLIAGEGKTELGAWANHPSYRETKKGYIEPGMIQLLCAHVAPKSFTVSAGVVWKKIPKYRAGSPLANESRNIRALQQIVVESGELDGVIFMRDRDGDARREEDIETALTTCDLVEGGVAIEESESWVLSLLGDTKAETHTDPVAKLKAAQPELLQHAELVSFLESADLEQSLKALPEHCASSLRRWIARVRTLLS